MIRLVRWFAAYWPGPKREAVLQQYRSLKDTAPLVLADIAARGSLYASLPEPGADTTALLIKVGRHQLALEILECAGADPDALRAAFARLTPPSREPL